MERQGAREQLAADELVERVVPPDVLAQHDERAVRRRTGRPRGGRRCARTPPGPRAGCRAAPSSVAGLDDRAGRDRRRRGPPPRRGSPCRRSRTRPSRRSGAPRRVLASNGCARWTVISSSGRLFVAGSANVKPSIGVESSIRPSVRRKPAASSRSCPGVRIVTATSTGASPGPAARIASGSSPLSRSSRSSTVPPRYAVTRTRVACRSIEGGSGSAGRRWTVIDADRTRARRADPRACKARRPYSAA